jgi:ankyrin repeat protein
LSLGSSLEAAKRRPHRRCDLAKGANIEARDNHGDTALKAAKRKRNTEMVKLLQEHGAH